MRLIKNLLYVSPFISCIVILWMLTERWIHAGQEPKADGKNKYAIILGAKVIGEVPSLSLQYRLDSALQYAIQYPHVTLILSGGQGPDEDITESEAMRRFLFENGVEEEHLLLESESTSTYENILFSTKFIPDEVEGITIITSDYHLARAKKVAEKLGFQTDVVVAKTPQVVEKRLKNRERMALLKTVLLGK